MNKVLVYVTTRGRTNWHRLTMEAAKNAARVAGVDFYISYGEDNTGYELGALQEAVDNGYERILLLQDSILIKDSEIIKSCFDKGEPTYFCNEGNSYLALFNKEHLPSKLPLVKDKKESIKYEGEFMRKYISDSKATPQEPLLRDCPRRTVLFNKTVMLIENDWFIKYKSVWDLKMLK